MEGRGRGFRGGGGGGFRGGNRSGGGGGRRFKSAPPVREGEVYDVKIEGIGTKGDGIGRVQGFVVIVPGVKEGDFVKVKVTAVRGKVAFGEVVGKAEATEPVAEEASEEEGSEEEASEEEYSEEEASEEGESEGDEEAFEEDFTEEAEEEGA